MAYKGVKVLIDIYFTNRFYNFEPLNQIASTSITITITITIMIINLIVILLAFYGLLQYREGWEQGEKATLANGFNYLVASARNKRLLWLVIIVSLFLINLTFLVLVMSANKISAIAIIISFIFISFISTAGTIVRLLGFLLSLSLVRIYKNNIFKYLAVIYMIPLVSMVISYLNSSINVCRFYFSLPSFFKIIENAFDSIIAFQDITIAVLLVIALSIYRIKGNNIQT
ncbi:MAG: hypothetical protein WC364_15015 [Eubacteriales bacterium]|jgi:hypothetical protein